MKRMLVLTVSLLVLVPPLITILPPTASAFRWTIQTINPTPMAGQENMIMVGSDGRVRIAYIDPVAWTVRYAVQNGSGWDDTIVAQIGSIVDYGRHIDMALDANDWPRILYLNTTGSDHPVYAEWDGAQWTFRDLTTVNPRCHLRIDVDSAGQPHVALGETFRVRYARWDGLSWLYQKLDVDNAGDYADIDVDGADTVRVAYRGLDSLGANLTMATRVGVSWVRELVEDSPDGEAMDVWLTSDSQNRPHIAYFDDIPTGGRVKYAKWTLSGWNITEIGINDNQPALDLDGADRPYMAIEGFPDFTGTLSYWNGTVWRTETWGGPRREMFGITVALNATDFPVIAWGSPNGLQIAYSMPPIPPSAPRNLVTNGGNGQVTLTWTAPASNGGSPIWAYKIYRGLSSGGETLLAAPGNVLSYMDTPLTNGVTYWYYVTAMNEVGEGPPSNEVNATPNSPPVLSGESVAPVTGSPTTDFVWQVAYTDAENHSPLTGEPKVHIRKASTEITGSPFQLTEADPLDVTFTDGKAYRYNRSLSLEGTDYSFFFSARDSLGLTASNTPISSGPTVAIPHTAPFLNWTGEPGYESDGVEPNTGFRSWLFTFRVTYSDPDGSPPSANQPVLDLQKGGAPVAGSPFVMDLSSWVGAIDDYVAGATYEKKVVLSALGFDYTYRCLGRDSRDVAVGTATVTTDGPDVVDRVPKLEWTGEVGFEIDGVNPDSGETATIFEWRINYTDDDNDPPANGYPRVHILKGGLEIGGSPFQMTGVDGADTVYSDGKLYRHSTILAVGADFEYYFEVVSLSSQNSTATLPGPQVSLPPNVPPTVTLNSPTGGESWLAGSTHQIVWSMDDQDDGASALSIEIFLLNGSTRQKIAGPLQGLTSFSWTLPAYAVSSARIEVVVTDPHGDNASDVSAPFDVLLPPADTTPPVARMDISPDAPRKGEQVTLDGSQSSDDSGTIASYTWLIYDSGGNLLASYTGEVQTHRFNSAGQFRVVLNVTDEAGNWDTETKELTVSEEGTMPEQFPFWILAAVLATACIISVALLVWRRSRRNDSKEDDSSQ